MANIKKQISAKGAWARMSARSRKLQEALETIGALAGDDHIQQKAGEGARYLRLIHDLAVSALSGDQEQRPAA